MSDEQEVRHFGPMHGERTRRHVAVVDGPKPMERSTILAVYEYDTDDGVRLVVELTPKHSSPSSVDLAVADAEQLREWLAEFIVAHGERGETR